MGYGQCLYHIVYIVWPVCNINHFRLSSNRLTEECISNLTKLDNLESLYLGQNKIKIRGVAFTQLEFLDLSENHFHHKLIYYLRHRVHNYKHSEYLEQNWREVKKVRIHSVFLSPRTQMGCLCPVSSDQRPIWERKKVLGTNLKSKITNFKTHERNACK